MGDDDEFEATPWDSRAKDGLLGPVLSQGPTVVYIVTKRCRAFWVPVKG